MNALADADPETMRISIDTKATVNVGEYSRGGRSRGVEAVKALDHDMCPKEKLIPGGILEPVTGRSFLFFGTSYKTSDFIVDGLLLWWEERLQELCGLKQLVLNMDNGPECSGRRTQFLFRLTEFADMTGLCVRIIYYPPYHSKYHAYPVASQEPASYYGATSTRLRCAHFASYSRANSATTGQNAPCRPCSPRYSYTLLVSALARAARAGPARLVHDGVGGNRIGMV